MGYCCADLDVHHVRPCASPTSAQVVESGYMSPQSDPCRAAATRKNATYATLYRNRRLGTLTWYLAGTCPWSDSEQGTLPPPHSRRYTTCTVHRAKYMPTHASTKYTGNKYTCSARTEVSMQTRATSPACILHGIWVRTRALSISPSLYLSLPLSRVQRRPARTITRFYITPPP
eukprot:645008-Rhodomonas_salina.2